MEEEEADADSFSDDRDRAKTEDIAAEVGTRIGRLGWRRSPRRGGIWKSMLFESLDMLLRKGRRCVIDNAVR